MKNIITYILVCVAWGLTWFAIRITLNDFPPFFSAGMRFAVASVLTGLILVIKQLPVPLHKQAIGLYAFMAVFSFLLPFGLVYWGEQYIPSGLASVLFAIYPFSVLIATKLAIPDEEITVSQIFGMIIGFSGIVVIFSRSLSFDVSQQLLGMLAVFLSAVMQSVVVVVVKKYGKSFNPITLNFMPMVIGAVIFLATSPLLENTGHIRFTSSGMLAVFYLAGAGSVFAFSAYYWLLKRMNIILVSLIAFITPVIALFSGWIFLGEQLEAHQTFGSVLVLAGLLASNANIFFKRMKHA